MDTESNAPKKYIRTLESDMATAKSGGTPDLVPLTESKPSPAERLITASPIEQIPTPINVLEPELQPIAQSSISPVQAGPTPIKTYSNDFSDKIKETNASTATILAAEQDSAHLNSEIPSGVKSGSSLKNALYIIFGIALFIVSGFGAYFAYTRYSAQIEPIILAPVVSTPIFVDEREEIFGTGDALFQEIEQSSSRPLDLGTVRLLYTLNATSTDNSVFSALQMPAPNILLRNINASDSMAGILNIDGSQNPFFIISIASYGDTFSGMLSWETTMIRDLEKLFPPYTVQTSGTSTMATSTSATTTPKVVTKVATTTVASSTPKTTAGFRDEVINNHDVRIYRDAENRSVLLYGYWDQKTLIVARDQSAFSEILRRLVSSQAQ